MSLRKVENIFVVYNEGGKSAEQKVFGRLYH